MLVKREKDNLKEDRLVFYLPWVKLIPSGSCWPHYRAYRNGSSINTVSTLPYDHFHERMRRLLLLQQLHTYEVNG